jgi:acyl transferase domain-containing protein
MTDLTGLEIAVIGMAVRCPGASTVDEFWDLVLAGTPTLRRFTDAELDAAGVDAGLRAHPAFVPVGGALDGVEHFDARFFGYSPRDAALIDPQQRLFLESCWHAMEHAGHRGGDRAEVVGVYASTSMSSYLVRHLLGNPDVPGGLSPLELVLSNDKDTLATRVAYHLDLTGPAISVQSACSSSLVAIHLACQALLSRDCDLAIAGGVSVRLPLHEGYRYHEGSILAPDGRCLPFDAEARGVVGGNGLAAVVLRPLADALRAGDTIHAVVRGTAVNNDGADKVGFTAPSVTGQAAVIRGAHEVSEVDSSTLGYVEAHGTGTALGDPIEVAALARGLTGAPGTCGLGSVKALVGHLDAAAGAIGFVKAALVVKHGVLPPSPYFRTPNPELGLQNTPFVVNPEPMPWPGSGPRRAGVSGFGMGGTNAHAVLEQPHATEPSAPSRSRQLLVLSAATPEALSTSRARLRDTLAAPEAPVLADVAHTLRVGRRTTLPHRTALVCADHSQAVALLSGGVDGPMWTDECHDQRRSVVFLFPGQGSQYAGMATRLHAEEPVFRAALDECADLLVPHLGTDLRQVIQSGERLGDTRFTQPALFAVEYALATLFAHWGVRPRGMLGHSVGEYVAACLAGVFDLPDVLALVAARGELMQRQPSGAMLAVPLGSAELTPLLDGDLALAASNAPAMSTVAGPADVVAAFAARLADRGVVARRLHTSHAFHSAMLDPMLPEFRGRVAAVRRHAPRTPFASNVTGDWITAEQATDPDYWARHARDTVRFSDGLRTVLGGGPAVLLELGPGNTLAAFARRHDLADAGHTALSSLPHPREVRDDLDTALSALGRLWLAGADVDLAQPTADERRYRVPLPQYPFARTRHWVDLPGSTPVSRQSQESEAVPVVPPELSADDDLARVVRIWQEQLGIARIGAHDNFFELGGHSLLATQILARMADTVGIALPAGAIFQAPTPSGLAELVTRARTERETVDSPDDDEFAQLLAEVRQMSPDELRAELDRERHAEEIPQP